MPRELKTRCADLDFVRASAAVLVLACHIRGLFFVDFAQILRPTWLDKAFYFFTGLQHFAVIIFFVLSGFFVAGSVHSGIQSGRWSWRDYASRRMARLWTVLVPTLTLTCFWDAVSLTIGRTDIAPPLRLALTSCSGTYSFCRPWSARFTAPKASYIGA